MAKKKESAHAPELLALYDKLVGSIPELERKGAAIPYTSLNGHMFSMIGEGGVFALRLPADTLEEFLVKYKTKRHESYGAIMKEYAVVPASLLKNTKELKPYFLKSYEYIASLKPKATTIPKKKQKA